MVFGWYFYGKYDIIIAVFIAFFGSVNGGLL